MKKLSFLLASAYTALLAFVIVCIDQWIHVFMPIGYDRGFTYVAFIAWAVYFFSGCTGKDGIRAAIGYAVGISFSIVISLLGGAFSALGFFAFPLAVFLVVVPVLYLEKVPWVNLIPAMFVASGTFFGMLTYVPEATYGTAAVVLIVYGYIGLLFGWITITGKNLIFKAFEGKK